MKRVNFLLLFFPLISYGVVHYFDLGGVTAKGKVTSFPSGLGWINEGYSFSASASVLEQKSFDFNNPTFGTSSEPMMVKPSVMASGLGQSWGGWSMVIVNQTNQINTRAETFAAGMQTQTKLNLSSHLLAVYLGTGKRISENWSLGWNLNLSQIDNETTSVTWLKATASQSLFHVRSKSKMVGASLGMGFIFDDSEFTFGMHLMSPMAVLKNTGIRENESLDTSTGNFMVNEEEEKIKVDSNKAQAEVGVRFGKQGFVYILSDQYYFAGSHKLNLGFEYAASWGVIATGYSHFDYNQNARNKLLVGFARTKNNFHWAVGPYYESELAKGDSGYNARSIGVLYASEIKY